MRSENASLTELRAVGIARIVAGSAVLIKAAALTPALVALADPGAIRLPLTSWLPPLPAGLFPLVIAVWVLAGLAFLAGWRTYLSGPALLLAMTCVLLGDQQLYSNHLYLLATLVLLLTMTGAGGLSVDGRRPGAPAGLRPWPLALLKLQVTIVYGFAALAKINDDFLSGAVLSQYLGQDAILHIPDTARTFGVMSALAIGAIAVELALALAIWSRSLTRPTIVAGVVFHVAIVLLLARPSDLAIFGMGMFALYVLHLPNPRTVVRGEA